MSCPTRPALAILLVAGGCAALAPAPPPEHDATLRLASGLSALDAGQHAEAYDELAWVFAHCHGRVAGAHALSAMAALELDPRNPAGRPAVGMNLLGDLILDPGTPEWLRPLVRTTYALGLGLGAPPPGRARPPTPVPVEEPDTMADPVVDTLPRADPDTLPVVVPDTIPAVVQDTESVAMPATVPVAEPDTVPGAPEADDPRMIEESPADPDQATLPEPVQEIDTIAAQVHGCGPPLDTTSPADTTLPTLPGPSLADMLGEAEAELAALADRAEALQEELATVRRALAETRAELDRIRRTLRP